MKAVEAAAHGPNFKPGLEGIVVFMKPFSMYVCMYEGN